MWAALSVLANPAGVGVVSALTIYGVGKYVTISKRDDARSALTALTRAMVACGARGPLPDTSEWVPADASDVSGKKYESRGSDWSSQGAFSCSGCRLSQPQYFRYRWLRSARNSGRFEAEADLNGDGKTDVWANQPVSCRAGKCELYYQSVSQPSFRF